MLAALLLVPLSAQAVFDPTVCDDDGNTETPSFGTRPGGGATCLYIDPLNGDPPIPFQYEIQNQTGISDPNYGDGWKNPHLDGTPEPGTNTISIVNGDSSAAECPPQNGECSYFYYNVTFDSYLDNAATQGDTFRFGNGNEVQYAFFKNVFMQNTWHCQGGSPQWNGPNGVHCRDGEDSDIHQDGWQNRGQPQKGGWLVFQDSGIVNNQANKLIYQTQAVHPPNGGWVFQGVWFGNTNDPVGEADHWIDDCIARGEGVSTCTTGHAQIGYNATEGWLIDVYGAAFFSRWPTTDTGKIIVVNTGCNTAGCGGTVGYNNGWPHPLDKESVGGGGACPNGPLPTSIGSGVGTTYCYTSLEEALQDHDEPPFIRLSCAGWENPPATAGDCGGGGGGGGTGNLNATVTFTTPIEVGNAPAMTATLTGVDGTANVIWDCDGDGQFDDGTPDNVAPYTSQTCAVINTPGTYTIGAFAADTDDTDTDTGVLMVTPDCGNNTTETPEVCDGTDLNGLDCTAAQFGDFTGGTLACESNCTNYNVAACTGGVAESCGDGTCGNLEGENDITCFEDCATSLYSVVCNTFDGWNYYWTPLSGGEVIDRSICVDQEMNLAADPITDAISGYRFIFDSDENSPFSLIQNSPAYTMCGDTGPELSNSLPCTPPLTRGSHTVAITPCTANWSGTFNVPPYPDSRCTGAGGTLGPTDTITFTVVYKQISQLLKRTFQIGMGNALVELASRVR